MKRAATLAIFSLLLAASASAHHVVWVDFQEFNLTLFPVVNGHAPTLTDVHQISELVFTHIVRDWAAFDIYFTRVRPENGRFTRLEIQGRRHEPFFGCAGPACCAEPPGTLHSCTGIGSWDDVLVSGAHVYVGELAASEEFRGDDATSARISMAIANLASHELGHTLGLGHCHAFADASVGCTRIPEETEDINVFSHIMSAGNAISSAGLPLLGDSDLHFAVHTSRRKLLAQLQTRNHYQPLPDLDGDGRADALTGHIASRDMVVWVGALTGADGRLGEPSFWRPSAGRAGDVFLTADVDGDRRSDLVYRRMTGDLTGHWFVRRSRGTDLGREEIWHTNAGRQGDLFRLADVTGDGRADLIIGRPSRPDVVTWFVLASTGTRFDVARTWAVDGGDMDDLFFIADVDGDRDGDLVYTRVRGDEARWFVRRSTRTAFGALETWRDDAGGAGNMFLVGDAGGDGDADLVYGDLITTWRTCCPFSDPFYSMNWFYRPSLGTRFGDLGRWGTFGDAGEMLRLGDTDGDGLVDLLHGRFVGISSYLRAPDPARVQWLLNRSLGGSWGALGTWSLDFGDDGCIYP